MRELRVRLYDVSRGVGMSNIRKKKRVGNFFFQLNIPAVRVGDEFDFKIKLMIFKIKITILM